MPRPCTRIRLRRLADVYADLGNLATRPDYSARRVLSLLRALIRAGLGKRLMFGSGLEVREWADSIGAAVKALAGAPILSGSYRDDIFYGSAERFPKLKAGDRAREGCRPVARKLGPV